MFWREMPGFFSPTTMIDLVKKEQMEGYTPEEKTMVEEWMQFIRGTTLVFGEFIRPEFVLLADQNDPDSELKLGFMLTDGPEKLSEMKERVDQVIPKDYISSFMIAFDQLSNYFWEECGERFKVAFLKEPTATETDVRFLNGCMELLLSEMQLRNNQTDRISVIAELFLFGNAEKDSDKILNVHVYYPETNKVEEETENTTDESTSESGNSGSDVGSNDAVDKS